MEIGSLSFGISPMPNNWEQWAKKLYLDMEGTRRQLAVCSNLSLDSVL